ncbi:MAG: peroxiredoxin family protein [Planctomycetota bacterium]
MRALLQAPALLFLLCLTARIAPALPPADPATHTEFSGALVQPGQGEGEILRRFEVQLFSLPAGLFFHVSDDLRQGCPWPDCFGITAANPSPDTVQPHLIYPFDGTRYFLPLPPLVLALPEKPEPGAAWSQQGWQMTVLSQKNVSGVGAWEIEAREPRGRRQTLTADATSGTLLRAEMDVFMGQGDQFVLTLARSASRPLAEAQQPGIENTARELIALQSRLKRRPDAQLAELSARQVRDSLDALPTLNKLATGTPLERLVRQIQADADQQQQRLDSAASRSQALMNSQVPDFSLSLVSGQTLTAASLKGRTTVLHFWDYRDAPLAEPYGQTGYLEFLFNRRRQQNLQVVGVSTNADLQSPENLGRGRRAARKIAEFMNLTYPIGYDDGSLLKALGDPRDQRGQLPLWVVISPEGRVLHYHAGYYEIDAAQGLRELEAVLSSTPGQ